MVKVFVYGTLKRGYPMGKWLDDNARYIGDAYTFGLLFNLGPFPGLKLTKQGERYRIKLSYWSVPTLTYGSQVFGELFEVSDLDVLDYLEMYEGVKVNDDGQHVGLYEPVYTKVYDKDTGKEHQNVLVYEYLGDTRSLTPLPEGEWKS